MIQELQSIKEQLFDAPSEVKEAFNTVVGYFSKQSDNRIDWEKILGPEPNYLHYGDSGYMSLEIWEAAKYALKKIKNYDGSNGPLNKDLIASLCHEGVMREAGTWVQQGNKDRALKYVLEKVNRNKSKLPK